MKKSSIFNKMLATYTFIIGFSFIVLAAFLSFWFKNYYIEQKKNQIVSESSPISQIVTKYVNNEMSLNELSKDLNLISDYFRGDIWLVDNLGYVYVVTSKKYGYMLRKQLFSDQITRGKKYNDINPDIKNEKYAELYDNSVYTIERPIVLPNGEYFGALLVFTPIFEITNTLNKAYIMIWISAILVIICASVTIYRFTQKNILNPLFDINNAAKKIAKGEVNKRVMVQSNDEIGELADSFNFMADSLEKIDENRRQFISNVSHEIRTPITSIKGFVGGILDGIVPYEKQNHYLNMAYGETERLIRLVNDLLDLSALESGNFTQIIKEIDINQIIRVTVLKLENKINDKELKVDVNFEDDKLMILGDYDRLIQVSTNLINNAIKYVNKGGYIKIKTRAKGNKAYISIFNTGDKINENQINKIWERFYRVDKARSSKISNGLGLPIVRGILSQLGEDIWVENINDGVKFTFTLKRIK